VCVLHSALERWFRKAKFIIRHKQATTPSEVGRLGVQCSRHVCVRCQAQSADRVLISKPINLCAVCFVFLRNHHSFWCRSSHVSTWFSSLRQHISVLCLYLFPIEPSLRVCACVNMIGCISRQCDPILAADRHRFWYCLGACVCVCVYKTRHGNSGIRGFGRVCFVSEDVAENKTKLWLMDAGPSSVWRRAANATCPGPGRCRDQCS
jgi:hypothetical protein